MNGAAIDGGLFTSYGTIIFRVAVEDNGRSMVDERKGDRKLWQVFHKGSGPSMGSRIHTRFFFQSDGVVRRFFREPAIIRVDGEQGFLDDTIDSQIPLVTGDPSGLIWTANPSYWIL